MFPIESIAAQSWRPLIAGWKNGSKPTMEGVKFGAHRFRSTDGNGNPIQSDDLQINGIKELHENCSNYLEEFDSICRDFLESLKDELPITIDGIRYDV